MYIVLFYLYYYNTTGMPCLKIEEFEPKTTKIVKCRS